MLSTLLFLGAATPACDCTGGKGPAKAGGQLVLTPSPVDFGTVIVGDQKEIDVTASNNGRSAVNIASIQTSAGFPADFRFSPGSLQLEAGQHTTLKVYFVPSMAVQESGTLLLVDQNSNDTLKLSLTGIGVKPAISIAPTMIDFGMTVVGEVKSQPVTITNQSNAALDVLVDPVVSANPGAFVVSIPGEAQSTAHVEANSSTQISVSFQPTQVGVQMGSFNLRACSSCMPVPVSLQGQGMASGLVADPDHLDFGAVLPMQTAVKPLTLKNIGNTAIQLKAIRPADANTPFTIDGITLPFALMPGSSTMLNVHFAPTKIGQQSTKLTFSTDDPAASMTVVPLSGYGGGPTALVTPATLDFGTVAIGYPVTRQIYITNTGLAGSNTSLDSLTVSAIDVPAPPMGQSMSLFSLGNMSSLPLAIAPSVRKPVGITFNPIAAGMVTGDLIVHTNDMAHPTVTVHLKANAVVAGPCSYQLSPAPMPGLQFGIVPRGRVTTQQFSLRNTGADDCVIGKLELTQGTNAAFTLPNGPVYGQVLAAGAELLTPVQFYPPGPTAPGTSFMGAVDLEMSSQAMPSAQLQLSGTAAEVCITISPASADFGVVKPLCETNEVNFNIYNSCSGPVTVKKIAIGAGAGDFVLLTPPLPIQLQPQNAMTYYTPGTVTSTTFQVRFHPQVVGSDLGNVQIYTDEAFTAGQPYIVPLSGRGDANASGQDNFVQGQESKVDVLVVADDSGSMADKQAKMAANYNNFMQFAIQQQIDYHIAVTTTGTDSLPSCSGGPPNAINGMFMPLMGSNRIITPQTPNPGNVFANNVNVGTDGCGDEQGMEGAYRAVSEPNVNGTNAGFLRPDALLAIVVVSDDEDSSPRPVEFYQNFFQSLKGPNGANMVTFNAVVVTDPNVCAQTQTYYEPTAVDDSSDPTRPARYGQLAKATGGILANICDNDWAANLQAIGQVAFGYKSRFTLSATPDPATITVTINGMLADASLWQYTQDTNSIDFLPTAVPPAGAQIQINYTVACQ